MEDSRTAAPAASIRCGARGASEGISDMGVTDKVFRSFGVSEYKRVAEAAGTGPVAVIGRFMLML